MRGNIGVLCSHGTGVRMRKHFEIINRSKVVRKNCTNNAHIGAKSRPRDISCYSFWLGY